MNYELESYEDMEEIKNQFLQEKEDEDYFIELG